MTKSEYTKFWTIGARRGKLEGDEGSTWSAERTLKEYWPPSVVSRLPGGSKYKKYGEMWPRKGTKARLEMEERFAAFADGFVFGFNSSKRRYIVSDQ